jgi:hypothetical protein
MKFLSDIISGKKKYFLYHETVDIKVPMCPELTVESVYDKVKNHKEIMMYLPDSAEDHYIERDFLFTIVNTCDRLYFKEALAELEVRRAHKAKQDAESFIEID